MTNKKAAFFAAYFILFLDIFGFAFLLPLFPLLLLDPNITLLPRESLEVTRHFLLGLILIAYPLGQFFGAPLFGQLSDRLGRKKMLYWTLTGTALGQALSAVALMVGAYSLLLVARIISGFFGATLVICLALITDYSPTKLERCRAIGMVCGTIGLSWILALLMEHFQLFNPAIIFWSMTLLACVNLIVLCTCYKEIPPPEDKSPALLKGLRSVIKLFETRQLRLLYAVFFFWTFGYMISIQWSAVLSLIKFRAHDTQINWFFLIWACGWMISGALFSRPLVKRISLWPLTLWCLFLLGLFLFDAGVSDFFIYFTIASVLGGIFGALVWTSTVSLISLSAKNEEQGVSYGVMVGCLALGQFLAPIVGGLITGFSLEPVLFACSLSIFIAFLFLLVYVVRRKSLLKNL